MSNSGHCEPKLIDPDLQPVLDAWPSMSDAIRNAILALVGTVEPKRKTGKRRG